MNWKTESRKEILMVFVNYSECKNTSLILKENDILTIRGNGKFIVKEQSGTTKKGRIKINIVHYR